MRENWELEEDVGKGLLLVFRMERLRHFGSVGFESSQATSRSVEGISETWEI